MHIICNDVMTHCFVSIPVVGKREQTSSPSVKRLERRTLKIPTVFTFQFTYLFTPCVRKSRIPLKFIISPIKANPPVMGTGAHHCLISSVYYIRPNARYQSDIVSIERTAKLWSMSDDSGEERLRLSVQRMAVQ